MTTRKHSLLKTNQVLTILWWLVTFRIYKIIVMKYWEDKGMVDVFAFEKAKETDRKESNDIVKYYKEQLKKKQP